MKIVSLQLGFLIFSLSLVNPLFSQEVTVILKNTKQINGTILEDQPDYILVQTDFGEIKIRRLDVERVLYENNQVEEKLEELETMKDLVIVHTDDNEVITGLLIAKGASALVIKTELGRMTVPKQRIKLVEYVSREYAERGEPVRVRLQNGQDLDGYLYHEDLNSLTLTTKQGRLTIEKQNLRSISYNVPVTFSVSQVGSRYAAAPFEDPFSAVPLRKRQDSFEFSFASNFGENFATGGGFLYRNRFLLKHFNTFSLNLEPELGITGFGLNKSILQQDDVPGSVTAKGGAMVSTLGIGAPFHFFPAGAASYEFFVTPLIETHLVYKALEKVYPSFPSLNSSQRITNFRFGLGSRIGMELALGKSWRLGLSFNMHYLFNDNDYNSFALHLGTRLF